MTPIKCRPVIFLILFFVNQYLWIVSDAECFNVECKLELFKPKGFRVTVEDVPGLSSYNFSALINDDIFVYQGEPTIILELVKRANGRWTAEDPNLALRPKSRVLYHSNYVVNSSTCYGDSTTYIVHEYLDRSTDWNSDNIVSGKIKCNYTVTQVWGGSVVCAGEVLLEENFEELRDDLWQVEEYIPVKHPEHPFNSYQKRAVSVKDGFLRIRPRLQASNKTGYTAQDISSGSIKLSGCTAEAACSYQESGFVIFPPVISGRITSRGFAFTYGTVHVRAKLPLGDWIYPEILLEPLIKKYGLEDYASGILKIACARGNEHLISKHYENISNKQLFGGPIMSKQCRDILLKRYKIKNGFWSDDFHVYTLKWTPDEISLSVDGVEWMQIRSPYINRFPEVCQYPDINPWTLSPSSTEALPFDQHFFITLGVAVGGTDEFPDNIRDKPWRNRDTKAMLNFWRDQDNWYKTWKQPELLVDYVKVVAL